MAMLSARLAGDKSLIGMFCGIGSSGLVEILGTVGYDFAIIDCQHGVTDPLGQALWDQIRTCLSVDLSPVVRVANNDRGQILKALDFGAHAVVVPQVRTADDARFAVESAHYAPIGSRSCCPGLRGTNYSPAEFPAQMRRTSTEPSLLLLIEDVEGVENAEEIASVPGVAGLFFGPFDLSVALGVPPGDPSIQQNREKVYAAAKRHNLLIGDFPWDAQAAQPMVRAGARLIGVGIDNVLFANAARGVLEDIRAPLAALAAR